MNKIILKKELGKRQYQSKKDNVAYAMSGAALGITDKMEAWPQPPLLILQAWPQDEGVRPCDSDLFFPFFG